MVLFVYASNENFLVEAFNFKASHTLVSEGCLCEDDFAIAVCIGFGKKVLLFWLSSFQLCAFHRVDTLIICRSGGYLLL
jgi:hypothetical protein